MALNDYVYRMRTTFPDPDQIATANESFVFFFEKKFFDIEGTYKEIRWFQKYWHYSFYYSVLYIAAVFGTQYLMRKREKFHLHHSLIAWNVVLAVFSVIGTARFLPFFFNTIATKGLHHSVCVIDYEFGVSGCWTILFGMSKLVDLVDTAFVVLRKQKLIFLHWYHHATTMIYTWYSINGVNSTGRWFIAMNFAVHSLMYSYYAFRAARFPIPKWVNVIITSLQLLQMVVGVWVNGHAYTVKSAGQRCDVSYANIYWSFLLYLSFFILFFQFFRNAYLKKGSSRSHAHKEIDLKHKSN